MSMLKVTKRFGLTLLCLGILAIPLALAGRWAVPGFPEGLSKVDPAGAAGEQIDQPLPGWEAAQPAPAVDPAGGGFRQTGGSAGLGPEDAGLSPMGWAKMVDNTGRIQGTSLTGADPEAIQLSPMGWAKMVDNTGRIQGTSLTGADPEAIQLSPMGWAKMVDNTGRIQGTSLTGADPEAIHLSPMGYAKKVDNTDRFWP